MATKKVSLWTSCTLPGPLELAASRADAAMTDQALQQRRSSRLLAWDQRFKMALVVSHQKL